MNIRRRHLFALTVIAFPLATISLPIPGFSKSFFSVIQGTVLLFVILVLLESGSIAINKQQLKLILCLLVFLVLLFSSAAKSGDIDTIRSLSQYIKFMLFTSLMGIFIYKYGPLNLENIFFVLSLFICVLALTSITDYMGLTELHKFSYDLDVRAVGLLGPPNRSGLLLAFAIGFNINYMINNGSLWIINYKSLVLLFFTIVAIIVLFISASRSGLILAIFFTITLLINNVKSYNIFSILFVIAMVSGIVLLVVMFVPFKAVSYFKLRIASSLMYTVDPTAQETMGNSMGYRIIALFDSINITKENPIFGVGPGRIIEERLQRNSGNLLSIVIKRGGPDYRGITAHNTFVNTFAECGIPAGIVLISLVIFTARSIYFQWKLYKSFEYCVLYSFFITYIVFLFSQSVLWRNNLLFILFIPVAFSFRRSTINKEKFAISSKD